MPKAIFIEAYGGYDKLKFKDIPSLPEPKDNEVIVSVRAAGLNFAEIMMRQGLYKINPEPPFIPGYEGCGVVKTVGSAVTKVKEGDRVAFLLSDGSWSEEVVVEEDSVFKIPDHMSFEEGAALPVNYVTAYHLLHDVGGIRPGHVVLCHMAAGGVGTAVGQLAKQVKDVTLIGTASAGKHEYCKENGYDELIANYRDGAPWDEDVKKHHPNGIDLVLDSLGGNDTGKAVEVCRPFGRVVCFGAAKALTGEKPNYLKLLYRMKIQNYTVGGMDLMNKNVGLLGYHAGYIAKGSDHSKQRIREAMTELMKLAEEKKIKPHVDVTFPPTKMAEAQEYLTQGKNKGKIVICFEEPKAETPEAPLEAAEASKEEQAAQE